MNVYRRIPSDPAAWFSEDEVAKARDYQRPLTVVRITNGLVTLAFVLAFIATGAASSIADAVGGGWVVELVAILAVLIVATEVLDLPFDLWREFRHERKWGFSTQTPARFASDVVKTVLTGIVLLSALLIPLWALIRSTELWWVFGWLVFFLFSVVLAFIGPTLLLPLFNKLEPLRDDALADELTGLGRDAGVRITGVQVMDASKRTRKDNAFFSGLGRTRKIVLYDNLLEQPARSVRCVVAHELGHWRRRHMPRQIVVGTVLSFAMFVLLRAVSTWDPALRWAGVDSFADPAALPLVMLTLVAGQMALSFATAWYTRALEREADVDALDLTRDDDGFQEMMRNLMTRNLADLAPSRLAYLRMDHPPAAERLQLVEEWRRARSAV